MSGLRTYLARGKKAALKTWFQSLDALLDGDRYVRYTYVQNGYHTPDYRFAQNEIMFVHLPKTGGTSFASVFQQHPEQRFVNLNIHKPVSQWCSPAQFRYVTVMRHPVDRVWSYYQMVLRNPEGYPYRDVAVQGLETFLKKCWAARNMQVRYISGKVAIEPNEATLRLASSNLQKFYAVLDFGNIGQEIANLAQQHGLTVEQVPNERKSSYAGPSAQERKLIQTYNQLDLALYRAWQSSR